MMNDDSEGRQFRILENYEEQNTLEFMGYVRYTCNLSMEELVKI